MQVRTPLQILFLLLSLYSENNPIHYFHCTVIIITSLKNVGKLFQSLTP